MSITISVQKTRSVLPAGVCSVLTINSNLSYEFILQLKKEMISIFYYI
jgi:fluoride ion exporter CrcB/FEX